MCKGGRGGVWPGKNQKYFKKGKLAVEFQIFFSFDILLKMLYNFVITNKHKIFRQKEIHIFKITTCILAQKVQLLTFSF